MPTSRMPSPAIRLASRIAAGSSNVPARPSVPPTGAVASLLLLRSLRRVRRDLDSLLVIALRASGGSGTHADTARQVVLLVIVAQLLAAAEHDGPPHVAQRAPRQLRARRSRRLHTESLAGRRPRG